MKYLRNSSLMAIATIGLMTAHANAQDDFYDRDKYEAVKERAQPDFDPEPVRVGTFVVRSDLTVGVASTDNVFAASGNGADSEESDTLLSAAASANARTDWSVHEIGLRGRLGRTEYSDFSDESFNELDVAASGRLDVSRAFNIAGEVSHRDSVQPRANYANGAQLDSPIEFNRSSVRVAANYQSERIRWTNAIRVTESDFDDGLFRDTNTLFEQDFRDNSDVNFTSRLSYAVSPNIAVFGQGTVSQTDYDSARTITDPVTLATTQRVRDSEGYIVAGGVNFETTNLLRGDIAVGFFSEDKEDEAFEDVDGLSVDGNVEWFPTRLTTVTFTAGRRVTDNGLIESPSTLQTSFGANVDHEFSRQVVGSVFANFTEDDYQEIVRTDDYRRLGAAITYKLNKRVHLTGSVQNIERDATITGNAFDPSFSTNEIGIALSIFP
ncbi:MAG: outer membrane beta-barrel protein [Pseudomonadota bacterium]